MREEATPALGGWARILDLIVAKQRGEEVAHFGGGQTTIRVRPTIIAA